MMLTDYVANCDSMSMGSGEMQSWDSWLDHGQSLLLVSTLYIISS